MRQKILSKSNYLAGLQCKKLLWIRVNAKHLIPEPDEETKLIFEKGHTIGELAKQLFPKGIDIPTDDFVKNLGLTKLKVAQMQTMFEPGFLKQNLYSRADILQPTKQGAWNIYEVKSAREVKDINIHDATFQKYVYEHAGLKIDKTFIIHKKHSNQKPQNAQDFFQITEITKEVEKKSENIEKNIENMKRIINQKFEPTITMGEQCNKPYPCPMIPYCKKLQKNSLFAHHI